MKRHKHLAFWIAIILAIFCLTLCACKNDSQSGDPSNTGDNISGDNSGSGDSSSSGGGSPALPEMSGITFDDATYDYDGMVKSLTVVGTPEGASVSYENNGKTDAGVYNVTAKITKDGYKNWTKTAKLTINKATLGEFTFDGDSFEYDTAPHSISVTGFLPGGEVIVYSGGEDGKNTATNVGVYEITANIGGKNYVQKTLKATLKITSKEELLATTVFDGNVYFQNPLDKNKFYCSDGSTVTKVSNDVPTYFLPYGTTLYYLSDALFTKGIQAFDGENTEGLFSINGENLATDGTYLYYSVNSLLSADKGGIFRVSIADLNDASVDPVATRITSAKATDLAVIGGYVYFANKSDGGKLYKVSSDATSADPSLVYNYKVSDFAVGENTLFFTRHITLSNLSTGAAIYGMDMGTAPTGEITDDSRRVKKITYSKGKYLTVVGDYLYFVNTDMLTTNIFGDGIYKVRIDGSDWTENLVGGTKVVDGTDNNIYSLSTDGTVLYYYRANNKHLYKYTTSEGEVDLMNGFVPPEEPFTPTTYYAKNVIVGNSIYFINMRDGGKLYKYDFTTKITSKITTLEVADFAINNNVLYYATVRLKTNFDLYSLDMVTGTETRISTDKCYHLSFTDDKIYYANFSGSNTLNSMNYDGTGDVVVFDSKKVDDYATVIYNGKLYFIAKGDLYAYDLTAKTVPTIVSSRLSDVEEFIIVDGKICLTQNKKSTNYATVYDIATDTIVVNASCGTLQIAKGYFVYGNDLYYFRHSEWSSNGTGLYRINLKNTTATPTQVTELPDDTRVCSPCAYNGKLYFTDVWLANDALPTSGTCKLMCYDFATGTLTELIS